MGRKPPEAVRSALPWWPSWSPINQDPTWERTIASTSAWVHLCGSPENGVAPFSIGWTVPAFPSTVLTYTGTAGRPPSDRACEAAASAWAIAPPAWWSVLNSQLEPSGAVCTVFGYVPPRLAGLPGLKVHELTTSASIRAGTSWAVALTCCRSATRAWTLALNEPGLAGFVGALGTGLTMGVAGVWASFCACSGLAPILMAAATLPSGVKAVEDEVGAPGSLLASAWTASSDANPESTGGVDPAAFFAAFFAAAASTFAAIASLSSAGLKLAAM